MNDSFYQNTLVLFASCLLVCARLQFLHRSKASHKHSIFTIKTSHKHSIHYFIVSIPAVEKATCSIFSDDSHECVCAYVKAIW